MGDFDVLDFNDFFIMKSIQVGDLRAEIKFLHFLQMGHFVLATVCAVYASKLLPYAPSSLAKCYRMRRIRLQVFFCSNSKSKIFASVDGAYAIKDKMVHLKKINFLFQPSSPLPIETLCHKNH